MDAHVEEQDYYVLFPNHTEGLKLYEYARGRGIPVRISPTPRAASACCGISLLVSAADIVNLERCIPDSGAQIDRIVSLPRQINPHRDRYC